MAGKKKNKSTVKKPSAKKPKPAEPNNSNETIEEMLKRIKSIYSVNGKFRSQLVERKTGGWICQIWSNNADGRDRPMIRNVQPFATLEEAIQMAQRCFAQLTGDDRYFAKEDIWKDNKPD
jgi:hypothetical protein